MSDRPARRGPRTPQGRAAVRHNALRHGLLSSELLLATEDPALLEQLSTRLQEQLNPATELEGLLVDRIVACFWRLARAIRVERAQMDEAYEEILSLGSNARTIQGQQRALRNMVDNRATDATLRYETTIERQLYRALHELQRLQASRLGGVPLPPLAVDLSVNHPGDGS